MAAGHLFMPARATATVVARVAFVGLVSGTGAIAGWRERHARELDGNVGISSLPLYIACGVIVAWAAAWIAYRVAHGS